jgi:hypothetical protein
MDSSPTLQDFVLNLIYDPGARSAFEIDPHGTLEAAGLGDVTAADVQDVLPLVLDYAPLSSVPALDGLTQVDDLTTGVANLDVAGAVAHLQTITAQIGGTASHLTGDLNIAAATTVTADHLVSGLGGSVLGGSGLTSSLSGGLTSSLLGHAGLGHTTVGVDGLSVAGLDLGGLDASHDPATGLDASVTTPVEHTVADVTYGSDGVVSHAGVTVTGTLDATVNAVTGLTGSLGAGVDGSGSLGVGGLDVSGVHEATSSIVGSVLGSDPTGGLLPDGTGVDGATSAVDHHLSGVTGVVGGLTHATEPEQGHDLLGGLGLHF